MKLIVGLGNPGKEYENTRHNAGFLVVNEIASRFRFPSFVFESKFYAEISKGAISGAKVILSKPQTLMNNSGKSVKSILCYYKIDLKSVVIIHDDLDIALGSHRISKNRGSAGHRGVESVIDCVGTKDFARIRIGIGIENRKASTENFVLEEFKKEEMVEIGKAIERIVDDLELGLDKNTQKKTGFVLC